MPKTRRQQRFEENVGRYRDGKQKGLTDDMFWLSVLSYHLCVAEAANHELEDIGLEPLGEPCGFCHGAALAVLLQCSDIRDR